MPFIDTRTRRTSPLPDYNFIETVYLKKDDPEDGPRYIKLSFLRSLLAEHGLKERDKVKVLPGQGGDFSHILLLPAGLRGGVMLRNDGPKHVFVRVGSRNAGWTGYNVLREMERLDQIGKYKSGGLVFAIDSLKPMQTFDSGNAGTDVEAQPDSPDLID